MPQKKTGGQILHVLLCTMKMNRSRGESLTRAVSFSKRRRGSSALWRPVRVSVSFGDRGLRSRSCTSDVLLPSNWRHISCCELESMHLCLPLANIEVGGLLTLSLSNGYQMNDLLLPCLMTPQSRRGLPLRAREAHRHLRCTLPILQRRYHVSGRCRKKKQAARYFTYCFAKMIAQITECALRLPDSPGYNNSIIPCCLRERVLWH